MRDDRAKDKSKCQKRNLLLLDSFRSVRLRALLALDTLFLLLRDRDLFLFLCLVLVFPCLAARAAFFPFFYVCRGKFLFLLAPFTWTIEPSRGLNGENNNN